MPILTKLRTISKSSSHILRYGSSFNSSRRYLIRARVSELKKTKRLFHQCFGASKKICDHNSKVNIDINHIYGRVAIVHVNKTRNMASGQGGTGIGAPEKESDDLSLPFWIFLWSFLAVIAGLIYSKLNKQRETDLDLKSSENHSKNDEEIARKLVNEIAKKDSLKKPTFRRQRSYEIIDGEVRIHYDVSMIDDSLHKSANIERFLKTAEVESIPIQSASLDDLEFVYPGKLPRIVEEGDEEILEDQSDEQASLPSVYKENLEAKGKEEINLEINAEKIGNISNQEANFEANGLHFERKQGEVRTNFETITQETIIPTESINDANKITSPSQKDNYAELSHQAETGLKEIKNEAYCDTLSSTSEDSVIENEPTKSNTNKNSLHNSNITSTSVYKLTQVEKTHEHTFTVTRREITKLKSNEEKEPKLDSYIDETSFPLVHTNERKETAEVIDNSSQLSRDLKCDTTSKQNILIRKSGLPSEDNVELSNSLLFKNATKNEKMDCGTSVQIEHFGQQEKTSEEVEISLNEVCSNGHNIELVQQQLDGGNIQKTSSKHEQELSLGNVYECPDTLLDANEAVMELSDRDTNECPHSSLQESCVLTCLKEGSDIPVDNSSDIKVTGSSIDEEDIEGIEEQLCDKNVGTLDVNENYDSLGCEDELAKNWKSLPLWKDVNSLEGEEENSEVPVQNVQTLSFSEDTKEARLLTFENTAGSRRTICVKNATDFVSKDESQERFIVESGIEDIINSDMLECEIPDEILVAVETYEVEAGCSTAGDRSDDPVFAKASVVEEDVLVAKIITVQDPEPSVINTQDLEPPATILLDNKSSTINFDIPSSGKTTGQTVLTSSETVINKSDCVTNLTEAEINPVVFEDIHSTPEQNCTTVSNMENGLVYCKSQTVNTIQTDITQTKVHSMVKKFEEARKQNTLKQAENGNGYLDSDVHETSVFLKNHKEMSDDVVNAKIQAVENSISVKDSALPEGPESVSLIPEKADVSTISDENEDAIPCDLKTDIKSRFDEVSAFTVETKQLNPSDEPCIISDSVNFVENVPTKTNSMEFVNDGHTNSEIEQCSSDKSLDEPPNMLELGSEDEDSEEIVICASQVTEVNSSDDENYVICETVEAVHARPVNDHDTTVVYANQVSDSENTPSTYCRDGNNLKHANGDGGLDKNKRSSTVVYTSESLGTTVSYTNQVNDNEADFQPVIETTKPSDIKIISPNQITEDNNVSTVQDSETTNPTSTLPPLPPPPNNECQSFMETSFDAAFLVSSPVTNENSSDLQENILNNDKMPLSSSPDLLKNGSAHQIEDTRRLDKIFTNASTDTVTDQSLPEESIANLESSSSVPEPKESPHELWAKLPRGETDVDTFSDIDEIDLDTLPDENYQKSKSVTDLDEALASFGDVDLTQDNMTGGLSKSVPDILDSCREESLRETETNSIETLQKKSLSLSTPEINSKPGSKKVTKIKIVHVKFLEMQSDSENVEEDSFIYEGEFPISGKMKRKSMNLSDEFSSPVASPPHDLNKEIAQERWIAEKTNLKQLEFEFGDLFENSPSPTPPYEANDVKTESSNDRQNQTIQSNLHMHEVDAHSNTHVSNDLKLESNIEKSNENVAVLPLETKVTSSIEKLHQTSSTIRSSVIMSSDTKSKVEYKNIQNSPSLISTTSETRNQEIPPTRTSVSQSSTRTMSFRYTPGNTHSYSTIPKPVPEYGKYVIKSGLITTQSKQTNTRITTTQGRYTESTSSPKRVAHYADSPNSPRRTAHAESSNSPRRVAHVESSNATRHVTTKARYIDSPTSSSPSSSPRHGMKLSEKFRMSDEGKLAQSPGVPSDQNDPRVLVTNQTDGKVVSTNRTDGQKTKKSHQRASSTKGTSRQDGRLVTVKSGIISDYECSSDADSEMSYNVPSPRVKAKKFHRPLLHRVDSASSSEPDSPRRQMKDGRRSMSELFGVDEGSQYSSDTSKDGRVIAGLEKETGSQNSLRNQKLFARFGNVRESNETVRRQNETASNSSLSHVYQTTIFDPRPVESEVGVNKERVASQNIVERNFSSRNVPQARVVSYDRREKEDRIPNPRYSNTLEKNPSPPNVYQARATTFDQRSTDTKTYNPRYTNALERNLSPTSFLQEGNLDDEMSPKTLEFNPFEDSRDGLQPFERCHSPSSVYSDTSSVFSFNCDFDPMPPPTGTYEPEVYTCENPMCRKQDILLGPEKTSFRSCPACFTFYCSSECRKLHWPSHKQSCYFGRVNTYVRSIIRLCQRREDLSMYLSQLARDGYHKKGRGVVMAIFNSPELAREFITKGHDAFSGRKPTYSSLAELHREGVISKHRVALMQAVRDYEPNQEFVFNIAVVATNNIPITPAPRYKLNTVLHCIKMPLNDLIVAREPRDADKIETRLFALPKCSRHEFVNEMEARRHYCRNLSKNLRQYNIKLKDDYPECYRKLCMYVEHNISFEPMTVYGQRGGINYKCVLAPEQTYPLKAEYC